MTGEPAILATPVAIAVAAALTWWASTGLVLWLSRRPVRSFPLIFTAGVVLYGAAFVGLAMSMNSTGPMNLYCAFFCGLTIWGFQELSFYLGYITGPRTHPCKPGCRGWRHLGHALGVSLYHEISIILTAGLLFVVTKDAVNTLGRDIFLIIWVMHQSARLNVFLGVRNVSAGWVPAHLPFLSSFLRVAPLNPFFIPSIVAISAAFAWTLSSVLNAAPGSFESIQASFVTSLIGLALLEHLCLVLPLPLETLWRIWGAPKPADEIPNPAGRLL